MRRSRRGKSWIGALFSPKHSAKDAPEGEPSSEVADDEMQDDPPPKDPKSQRSREELETLWAEAKASASRAAANAGPLGVDGIEARIAAARRLAASVSAAPAARALAPPASPQSIEAKKEDGKPEGVHVAGEAAKQKEEPKAPSKPETPPRDESEKEQTAEAVAKLAAAKEAAAAAASTDGPEKKEKDTAWTAYWRRMAGGSLLVSLGVHLALLTLASFIVSSVVKPPAVDFLSGGGSKAGREATQELAERVRMKKLPFLRKPVPMRKVVSESATAIALPDLAPDTMELPQLSSMLGGTMGSGGFGSGGSGGGFGDGMGIGGMSGRTFKPITMFGKDLGARSIAVILDVSGSMTPHLTAVVKELDRVARNSPVVLYVGCGVSKPPQGMRLDDNAIETRRRATFDTFWRSNHNATPQEEAVYDLMVKRPYTYFIKDQGINYAWVSLLTTQVRNAEALYWFSDFQDQVEDGQMKAVLENLKRRRQKLFIHASEEGDSFADVKFKLALPSGGAVIESRPGR